MKQLYKFYYLVFLSFAVFSTKIQAQNLVLEGKVIDNQTSQPVSFANVEIWTDDKKAVAGTVTDEKGSFTFKSLILEKGIIKVRFVGYETFQQAFYADNKKSISFPTFRLKQQNSVLNEVIVSGQKSTTAIALDKQIIDPKKFQLAANGTGLDLLQKLPSVTVTSEGDISLRGSAGFIVLINGKPSNRTPADILSQLPANTIQNIEILTSPSAKYDADGKTGIINIITLQNVNKGWSLTSNGMFGGGNPSRFGGDLTLNYGSKKWDFYASADYRRYDINGRRIGEVRTIYKDTLTYLPSDGLRDYKDYQYSFRTGFAYNPNANNSFSFNLYKAYKETTRQADLHYQEYFAAGSTNLFQTQFATAPALTFNENTFVRSGDFSSVNLDYNHTFSNKAKLALVGIYEHSVLSGPLSNSDKYESNLSVFLLEKTNENSPLNALRLQADYTLPIGKTGKFGAGAVLRSFKQNGTFNYYRKTAIDAPAYFDPLFNDAIDVNQQIRAGYVQFENVYRALSYNVGLRVEDMDRSLKDQQQAKTYQYQQVNLFPSAQFLWKVNNSQDLRLGYNRRIDWPTIKSLSPFLNHRHKETIENGDPNLKPEIADIIELSYSKTWSNLKLVTTAFRSFVQNKVFRTNYIDNRIILGRSYTNGGDATSTGLEISADIKATNWWRFYVGTSVYDFRVSNILNDANASKNSLNYTINANTSITINPTLRLQWDLNYVSATITSQGNDGGILLSNIGLKQNIWKNKGTIGLQLNNIFQSNSQKITTQSATFYSYTDYIKYDRVLQLSLGIRLNESSKKVKSTKTEYGEKEF
ncbi:TonB-dependent receptor [Arcicella lustrica]|uniref:TonB-dependent receptor n=1 Tax=Arcicella lustrica TaxID=2984196 RepID=A0ABU5SH62_9BACT|nr:TonB-dependent receptor [Arcicella sp. DC25W]MEA5426591.1 TonB-dependent receptor [Arcicella sp. DC25W]